MAMTKDDLRDLREAKRILENPSFAARLANLIGQPIQWGLAKLPAKWTTEINRISRTAIEKALNVAVSTLDKRGSTRPWNKLHKAVVTTTGAVGGYFGIPGLAVELPISTTIMLRSIADVARSNGEQIQLPEAQLACVTVFALGGTSPKDDASETGYFAVRAALARSLGRAAECIANKGLAEEGAPALIRLIAKIAARFETAVSEKAIAQSVPVIGALGGGAVNYMFMDHFQDMARGHFIVRRLERTHGAEVKVAYDQLQV